MLIENHLAVVSIADQISAMCQSKTVSEQSKLHEAPEEMAAVAGGGGGGGGAAGGTGGAGEPGKEVKVKMQTRKFWGFGADAVL